MVQRNMKDNISAKECDAHALVDDTLRTKEPQLDQPSNLLLPFQFVRIVVRGLLANDSVPKFIGTFSQCDTTKGFRLNYFRAAEALKPAGPNNIKQRRISPPVLVQLCRMRSSALAANGFLRFSIWRPSKN